MPLRLIVLPLPIKVKFIVLSTKLKLFPFPVRVMEMLLVTTLKVFPFPFTERGLV